MTQPPRPCTLNNFWQVTLLFKQVQRYLRPRQNLFAEEEQHVPAILGDYDPSSPGNASKSLRDPHL